MHWLLSQVSLTPGDWIGLVAIVTTVVIPTLAGLLRVFGRLGRIEQHLEDQDRQQERDRAENARRFERIETAAQAAQRRGR